MNHYNQAVSDNSSAVELFHLHPENLWLKFWCQTDWAIQMTKHSSSFYPIFPFLLTKQIPFNCPHQPLLFTLMWLTLTPSLITSSGASLLSCLFWKLPAPLFLSAVHQPAPSDLLLALWPALGSHRHPCGAHRLPRAVDLAKPVLEVAVWISGLSWDCAAAAACCLIQLRLHSRVPTAFHIPPGPSTSQPYMAKSVETQD